MRGGYRPWKENSQLASIKVKIGSKGSIPQLPPSAQVPLETSNGHIRLLLIKSLKLNELSTIYFVFYPFLTLITISYHVPPLLFLKAKFFFVLFFFHAYA